MRPQEIIALRQESVAREKRQSRHRARDHKEARQTKRNRYVLLNGRALHTLEFAAQYAERRKAGSSSIKEFPYVSPPLKMSQYIRQTSDLYKQWAPTLKKLATRYRPPYNCRHTYATICTMSGMNPAFIAQQLGHSVQMLLSTYARWLNSSGDWGEMEKLQNASGMAQASNAQPATH
ncbi:integrase [Pseudomonas fluorescens]